MSGNIFVLIVICGFAAAFFGWLLTTNSLVHVHESEEKEWFLLFYYEKNTMWGNYFSRYGQYDDANDYLIRIGYLEWQKKEYDCESYTRSPEYDRRIILTEKGRAKVREAEALGWHIENRRMVPPKKPSREIQVPVL